MKKCFSLVYDATILANGVDKNSGRTGIYFTALNLLKILAQKTDIKLTLFCSAYALENLCLTLKQEFPNLNFNIITDSNTQIYARLKQKREKYKKQKKYLKKLFLQIFLLLSSPIFKLLEKLKKVIEPPFCKSYDAFFSPVFAISTKVTTRKYTILYDIIPTIFPEYYIDNKAHWYNKLLESLNKDEYYFAISEYTKQDFLKHFPQIDPNKITTTLLACDEKFDPRGKNLNPDIRVKYNIPEGKKYIFSLCSLEPRKNLIRTVKTFIQFIKKTFRTHR